MRIRSHRRFHLGLMLLATALLLIGCGRVRAPRYFDYLNTPANATLSGKLGEVEFTALLVSEGRHAAVGTTLPLACDFTLTYLSPTALSGMTVRYHAETDELSVTMGELTAKGRAYETLAAPARLLLTESAPQTTARAADGTLVFNTEDGARRTLSPDGQPLALSQTKDGRHVEIIVQWVSQNQTSRGAS